MEIEFIRSINYKEFTDIATEAKEELFISMPNLHDELCEVIISCKDHLDNINVIIDNSEDNYRNGFGEIKGISKMKEKGINIFNIKGNYVSFIIADKIGYYLFPQSRIFTDEKKTGLNAVAINPINVILLKKYFFNKNRGDEDAFNEELYESINLTKQMVSDVNSSIESNEPLELNELKKEEISEIKEKLKINPPLHPDLKRNLTTYTSKIQYVEFSFEGAHLNSSKINIPPDALPFKDANIKKKLKTKMLLFGNDDELNKFNELNLFNSSIELIRKEYLTPLSSRKDKSIIKIERKNSFIIEYKMLEKKLKSLSQNLKSFIQDEILKSEDQIKLQLFEFFKENIPDNLKEYKGDLLHRSIERETVKVISRIKFPAPEMILNKMRLTVRFYDLTYEDFKDDELIKEFKKKEIMEKKDINDIVEFNRAYAEKKEI